ncbi:MAG: formylglycine-generating enzyme family protein [Magnetococcales bacterium]|nr:formylglycine-generating enzyme family protein [Magnetococcales bacterium]
MFSRGYANDGSSVIKNNAESKIYPITDVQFTAKYYVNSLGIEFVMIPSGSFIMGTPHDQTVDDHDDEIPQHLVTISKAFYIGKKEITQAQWEAVMGSNPSEFKSASQPVENVNWYDVQQFIYILNKKEGAKVYRLPTEAEWEYAARAGTTTQFYWGKNESEVEQNAWYGTNSGNQTHPVGQRQPNAWGLYDMAGNVWEWVQDCYDSKYYVGSHESDPSGPIGGSNRVARGGGWDSNLAAMRVANRNNGTPRSQRNDLGFRLVMVP